MLDRNWLEQTTPVNGLRKFAREVELPEAYVIAVYERELNRLREGARVQRFVCIRAEKCAKEALRAQGRRRPSPVPLMLGVPSAPLLPVHVASRPGFLTFKSAVAYDRTRTRLWRLDRQIVRLLDIPLFSMGPIPI